MKNRILAASTALALVGSRAMFASRPGAPLLMRGMQVAFAPDDDRGQTDSLLREVKSELERINGEVKKTAEQALREVKDNGSLTAELKNTADKLLTDQTALKDKADKLEQRQLEIEQGLVSSRDKKAERPKSFGEQVAADDGFKAWVKNGARGSHKVAVQNAITSADGSAGDLIVTRRETEIVGLPRRRPRIRSLLNAVSTDSNMVEYAKMVTRTNGAAVVAEGATKPQSNYVWDRADAPVRTIAHWVPVTRQALEDAKQLRGEIDSELRYGLDLAEDEELLNGDGTGQHLSGLRANATAYAAPFAVDNETPIDTLRLAILQLELADYYYDGTILNPTEWARIELTKDANGQYVFANVLQLAGPTLWGRPVVSTTAMDAGDFMVGQYEVAATIYDRMDAEVLFSSEDQDNFIKNMLTARAEKRLALAVKRGAALVDGTFTLTE